MYKDLKYWKSSVFFSTYLSSSRRHWAGIGLVRAGIYLSKTCKELGLKVHVANASYGEAISVPDYGRFIDILKNDVINQAGCMFVSSAGNAGPALTTGGSVGSYVSQFGCACTHFGISSSTTACPEYSQFFFAERRAMFSALVPMSQRL